MRGAATRRRRWVIVGPKPKTNEVASTSYGGGQTSPHFGGPTPLLTMVTATEMTIGQDPQSMGIEYPNQPYRDIKWGEQKRGLFTIDAGWEDSSG